MVCPYLEVVPQQVDLPLLYGVHDCQEFFFMGSVVLFSVAKLPRGVSNGLVALPLILGENSSNGIVGGVSGDSEEVFSVWAQDSQNWGLAHPFLEFLECLLHSVVPLERGIFVCESC